MEIVRKRKFWLVYLAVVGLCSVFAGRAAAHLSRAGISPAAPATSRCRPSRHKAHNGLLDPMTSPGLSDDVHEFIVRNLTSFEQLEVLMQL